MAVETWYRSFARRLRAFLPVVVLVTGCEPDAAPAPATTTPAAQPPKPETATPQEEVLPPGHFKGVAGLRSRGPDGCPERYLEVAGLCAHERLTSMQTDKDFKRSVADFKRGIAPPIVADAPAPATRDPSRMDPGALVATKEELAKREAGRGPSILKQFSKSGSRPAVDEEEANTEEVASTAADKSEEQGDGQVTQLVHQMKQLDSHMEMLQDVRAMTGDGEMSKEDLGRLKKLLETTNSDFPLDQMIESMVAPKLEGIDSH